MNENACDSHFNVDIKLVDRLVFMHAMALTTLVTLDLTYFTC